MRDDNHDCNTRYQQLYEPCSSLPHVSWSVDVYAPIASENPRRSIKHTNQAEHSSGYLRSGHQGCNLPAVHCKRGY